jgi:hypothetical protein
MNYRIEQNARSKTKATVWSGRIQVATFWKDDPTGHADAKIEAMLTAAELRTLADELDKWSAGA